MSRIVNIANLQQFTAINLLSDPGVFGGPLKIPGAIQVVFNWTLAGGKTGHNVTYSAVSSQFTPTAADCDSFLTRVTTGASWTALAATLSTSTALAGITMHDVRDVNLPIVTSVGAAHPGTNAAVALPNEMAICLTLRTERTGIANRGRMYIPGFSVDQVIAGNLIAAGAMTAIANWVPTVSGAFTAMPGQWALGHPQRNAYTGTTGTEHGPRPPETVPLAGAVVRDNHWDSQRRRGLK